MSARAGLLFRVLDHVSRRQSKFTFYPVEASLPMGVGMIGDAFRSRFETGRRRILENDWDELSQNIAVQEFFPFLAETRKRINVDVIVGLFAPMLAYTIDNGDNTLSLEWNYFSVGEGREVAISSYGIREYASKAGRPFEAAIAMMTMAQVWSSIYNVGFHEETRGCPFDFCENRDDLVGAIKRMELCAQSLEAIPANERDSVLKCLEAIRDYCR
ncbi:hypothetical protein [Acetobacter sp. KSO5]|uniref:hypothetical protein n=1 Tax=Acetobacter sp. KSO5 TaxID=3373674 RepID=UPI00376EC8DD